MYKFYRYSPDACSHCFPFSHSIFMVYACPECSILQDFTNTDTSTDSLVSWVLNGFSQWESSQVFGSYIKSRVSVLILWPPSQSYCWGLVAYLSQWPLFLSGGSSHIAFFFRFWWSWILLWFLSSRIGTFCSELKCLCFPL